MSEELKNVQNEPSKQPQIQEFGNKPERILPRDANAQERAKAAAQICADNRGRDIVILDMRELSTAFDYFVIATGSSRRQLHAISEEIDRIFEKEMNDKRLGIEGYQDSRWILLDYGDIVVHLFVDEAREHFRLEELWAAAPKVEFVPAE